MAEVSIRFTNPGTRNYTVGNDVVGGAMKMEAIGAGGSGGTGAVFGGGGGKGGAYAMRTSQSVGAGDVLSITVPPTTPIAAAGAVATVVRSGVTLLSARGGDKGGNADALNGGAGATAQVGTFIGDIEFTGGNGRAGATAARGSGGGGAGRFANGNNAVSVSPGGGGAPIIQFDTVPTGGGGAASDLATPYGGAGVGQITTNAGTPGAQGIVVLTYSTGVGQTSPSSTFSRLATLFRVANNSTVLTSIFNRAVTIRRAFSNTTVLQSDETKQIQLPRSATTNPLSAIAKKAVSLFRTATIVHTPTHRKDLTLGAKVATTENRSIFARAVTIRRTFQAITRPVGKLFLFLEARLIPREGGGGTVTNVFRNLFLFDD